MSVNKKARELPKKAAVFAVSVLCGMLATGVLTLMFSAAMYFLGLLPEIAGVLSFVSFAAGCMLAGFVCGRIKQHGGLRAGIICALLMTAAVAAGSFITGGLSGESAFAKLTAAVCASCTGSVWGVNRR